MTDFEQRYVAARKAVIARDLARLNPMQRQGAMTTEGPLLLLAGAGSGKTTVLIQRVYNLLTYGRGSDSDEVPDWATEEDLAFLEQFPDRPDGDEVRRVHRLCAVDAPRPWEIIAITFTNKAAGELKERLAARLGPAANDVWASTFHSACVRILRRDIDRIGFDKDFTIYDTDDAKRVIKDILKEQNLDEKTFPVRSVLSAISASKDRYEGPEVFRKKAEAANDWKNTRIAKIYAAYQQKLSTANALDFDDIIYHTVTLLQKEPEVLDYYQKKFRYVLVDEYQDTNHLQYLLTGLLAGGHRNLCVVGDDDQSIYRFRGANIENILNFEKQYKDARVIRLEQNYRSTQHILDAANAVIKNNEGRKGKTLWTDNGSGDVVTVKTNFNEGDEANFVAGDILMGVNRGRNFRDTAILYRMNAQSNALEYAFKRNGVPYKIYGGMKFFDRAEVKDMLAYLCVISNTTDDLRLRRIVNVPSRKIGQATVDKAQLIATEQGSALYDVFLHASDYPELKNAAGKLIAFTDVIESLRRQVEGCDLVEFYDLVCDKSGYTAALREKDDMESRGRLENVEELKSSIQGYMENAEGEPTLAGFLDEVALYTDLDSQSDSDNCVTMMTMHAAKGLEFPHVYVVGMEDGLFPGNRAMGDAEEMEEERRLCYVAMTRAKEKLTLTNARQRTLYGKTTPCMPSRFLSEIPEDNMEWLSKPVPRSDAWEDSRDDDGCAYGYGGYTRQGTTAPTRREVPAASRPGSLHTARTAAKAPSTASYIQLQAGETVEHDAFGRGLVLSVRPMGGDALLEVAFDTVGTKKLMLKAASHHLKKV